MKSFKYNLQIIHIILKLLPFTPLSWPPLYWLVSSKIVPTFLQSEGTYMRGKNDLKRLASG